jgi:aspartate/methionine/tyrosine aminotransferase
LFKFLLLERDGHDADPDCIFLTSGASQGVQSVLQCLAQHSRVGVMIPIPQYPLYTATLALNDSTMVPYYLDEESDWALDVSHLSEQLRDYREEGQDIRALCVINPGNPTGNCLTRENIQKIIDFCYNEKLVLLADEVYQANSYLTEKPFVSFKKVLMESPEPIKSSVELFSFHSVSKGVLGNFLLFFNGFKGNVVSEEDILNVLILIRMLLNSCINLHLFLSVLMFKDK